MTQDEIIIAMAREAGFDLATNDSIIQFLERFSALVAAHEREKAKAVFEELEREVKAELINAINGAVELEREACAKVCEDEIKSYMSKQYTTDPLGGYRERFAAEQCAAAIRARGDK